MVYKADLLLGMMREPMVSVPMETGANPAVTATVELVEEPSGFSRIV